MRETHPWAQPRVAWWRPPEQRSYLSIQRAGPSHPKFTRGPCAGEMAGVEDTGRDAGRGSAAPPPNDLTPFPDLVHSRSRAGPVRERRPVYVDLLPPCNAGCPAGANIQAWLAHATARYEQAWRQLVADNPFAAIHGRVCYHPCETACNRAHLDSSVSIHSVERSGCRRHGHVRRRRSMRPWAGRSDDNNGGTASPGRLLHLWLRASSWSCWSVRHAVTRQNGRPRDGSTTAGLTWLGSSGWMERHVGRRRWALDGVGGRG